MGNKLPRQKPIKTYKEIKLRLIEILPSNIIETLTCLDNNNQFTIEISSLYTIRVRLLDECSRVAIIYNEEIKTFDQYPFISTKQMVQKIVQYIDNAYIVKNKLYQKPFTSYSIIK